MINQLKEKIMKLINTGFFSIFIANIFSKVIALFGGIVLVRILSQEDYGIYGYAINAMTILYLLNDFGASTAALQFLTEAKDDKPRQSAILKYALKIGLLGSTLSGILILLSPFFYTYKIEEAKYLTPMLCLFPVFSNIAAFISVVLRANQQNNKYAIVEFSRTIFDYLSLIIFAILFGLKGAILSRYVYIILTLILGMILSKKVIGKTDKNIILEKKEKKEFLSYSITTQFNSTISGVLLNIDIFLIGALIGTATSVAIYKVASTIPMALSFLPTCVMIYVLPYFIIHKNEPDWVRKYHRMLLKYGAIGYGIISIGFIVFAKLIFNIIYTTEYNDAILPFQILIVGFFFSSTFKIPTNNVISSMRKVKVNFMVSLFSAILNFILNIFFINQWGIVGAAITTTIINIVSSVILMIYVNKLLKAKEREKKEDE